MHHLTAILMAIIVGLNMHTLHTPVVHNSHKIQVYLCTSAQWQCGGPCNSYNYVGGCKSLVT